MDQQYITCQHANGQFYRINALFQPLTNPSSYITALFAKNDQAIKEEYFLSISHVPHPFAPVADTSNLWIIPSTPKMLGSIIMIICPDKATSTVPLQQPFHILRLSPACSATSRYLLLPAYYKDHTMMINVSMDTANINAVNVSALDFRIWQHFNSNWTSPHLQKLVNVPEVPVTQPYNHMINTSEPIHSFKIKDEDQDPSLIWTILTHPGTYIGTIGMIFAVYIGVSTALKHSGSGLPPLSTDLIPQSLCNMPSTEVEAQFKNPEDPARIMTCTLNERLQGWRVTLSNLLCQKEFL